MEIENKQNENLRIIEWPLEFYIFFCYKLKSNLTFHIKQKLFFFLNWIVVLNESNILYGVKGTRKKTV